MDALMDLGFVSLVVLFFVASAALVRFCAGQMGEGNKS